MKHSKQILFYLIISSSALLANSSISSNLDGRALYTQANCHSCHNDGIEYDAKNHKVKNLKDLDKWIVGCGINFDTDWEDKDDILVGEYLNDIHYKLVK